MRRLQQLIKKGLPFLWLSLLTGCSDDTAVYPSLRTDLVDLQTDATGTARFLITDEGTRCRLQTRSGLDGLAPDTLYRILSQYERLDKDEPTVVLYSARRVVSSLPVPESQLTEQHEDPVELQSIWRSGRYLNLILQVKAKDPKHIYQLIDQGITEKGGQRTLHLSLYHDRKGDAEAFHQPVYVSVPLWPYAEVLQANDSVTFHLNTYREGKTSRSFAFGTIDSGSPAL